MGYPEDKMQVLTYELRKTKELVVELKRFNDNIEVFERLAIALEKQNELKAFELKQKQEYKLLDEFFLLFYANIFRERYL